MQKIHPIFSSETILSEKTFLHVLLGRYDFFVFRSVFVIKVQFSDKKYPHTKVFLMCVCVCSTNRNQKATLNRTCDQVDDKN